MNFLSKYSRYLLTSILYHTVYIICIISLHNYVIILKKESELNNYGLERRYYRASKYRIFESRAGT